MEESRGVEGRSRKNGRVEEEEGIERRKSVEGSSKWKG